MSEKKPSAKKIGSRVIKRWIEHALGSLRERYAAYTSWIILLILSLLMAAIIFNWVAAIKPPALPPEIEISVKKLDHEELEVMIIFIGSKTDIQYLTYETLHGKGFINKSINPLEPVRDAGESGIIPAPDYGEPLEIFATLGNSRRFKIYNINYTYT